MNTHEQYNGIFVSTNQSLSGYLNIAGADSILKLVGQSSFSSPESDAWDVHGTLSDGRKASLLHCVSYGTTQHYFGEDSQSETTVFPNYIVVGDEFINSNETVIQAARYHFENAHCFISGHKTFQTLRPNADEVYRILEDDYKRREKIALEHNWPQIPFKPEIGDFPSFIYFSGLWELISADTAAGKISLTNRTSHSSGNSSGIGFKNEITANILFAEPKTLDDAIDSIHTLHSLFELVLGHRQRYLWIELELTHRSKSSHLDIPQTAKLHWSLCNERVTGNTKINLHDVLISPDIHPKEFVEVTRGWMNSAKMLADPRARFATAFFGKYGINRIVGAANMFDLLPESHAPKTKEVDPVLQDAVRQCRNIFKNLPKSFAKDSVLSSLGRIGKPSLRDKIYYRAKKLIEATGGRFEDIYLPCSQAVIARNHYVHGSARSFDYQENFSEFAFITDSLEFIFAASDLLDLGWDINRWISQGTSMTHHFGAYIANYRQSIIRLENLVGKSAS